MTTLMLVPPSGDHPKRPDQILSDQEKLKAIKGEINSAIEDRVEKLRFECETMRTTMESVLYRIGAQGFDLTLNDLKTGSWHKTATEIRMLQAVREFIQSLE